MILKEQSCCFNGRAVSHMINSNCFSVFCVGSVIHKSSQYPVFLLNSFLSFNLYIQSNTKLYYVYFLKNTWISSFSPPLLLLPEFALPVSMCSPVIVFLLLSFFSIAFHIETMIFLKCQYDIISFMFIPRHVESTLTTTNPNFFTPLMLWVCCCA